MMRMSGVTCRVPSTTLRLESARAAFIDEALSVERATAVVAVVASSSVLMVAVTSTDADRTANEMAERERPALAATTALYAFCASLSKSSRVVSSVATN